jgi:hypothetical protein
MESRISRWNPHVNPKVYRQWISCYKTCNILYSQLYTEMVMTEMVVEITETIMQLLTFYAVHVIVTDVAKGHSSVAFWALLRKA